MNCLKIYCTTSAVNRMHAMSNVILKKSIMGHFKLLIFLIYVNMLNLTVAESDPRLYCWAPSDKCHVDIPLFAEKISTFNCSRNPFIYYDNLDFCKAAHNSSQLEQNNNLSQVPYNIKFLTADSECVSVCRKTYTGGNEKDDEKLRMLKEAILCDYHHYWHLGENLVLNHELSDTNDSAFGFPMGCYIDKQDDRPIPDNCDFDNRKEPLAGFYVFNHIDFIISYGRTDLEIQKSDCWLYGQKCHIFNVSAIPRSIHHKNSESSNCHEKEPLYLSYEKLKNGEILNITYTYSPIFVQYILKSQPPTDRNKIRSFHKKYFGESSALRIKLRLDLFIPSSLIFVLYSRFIFFTKNYKLKF